jgi:LacI family transcriptional regulator
LRQLRSDIAAGVDAVGLVNQIFPDINTIFNLLEEKHIPYIMVNVDAPETNRLCYIGPDYPAGGRIAAEVILKMMKNLRRPKIGVILSSYSHEVKPAADIMLQRFNGFREVVANSSIPVNLITKAIPQSEGPQKVEKEIDDFLAAHHDFAALYLIASYNEILERVIARNEQRGKLVTVVHDLDSRTEECLESEAISAVIYQNPILQGYYAVKLLEHFLETGKSLESKTINIVHSIIMRQNKDLAKNNYLFAEIIGELET